MVGPGPAGRNGVNFTGQYSECGTGMSRRRIRVRGVGLALPASRSTNGDPHCGHAAVVGLWTSRGYFFSGSKWTA